MASDFFYPNVGGVEEHIYTLSQCLILRGHKVIVVTHSYGDRVGVRYLTNGLKVYYLPIKVFYNQCVLPTMISSLPLIRYILIREKITIVHGHSAFSALAHEVMMIGRILSLKTVFTDHSLFGFADTSAIITNKFLEISLASINHCICVSHIGKENTVLRARVNHKRVSVISNSVDTTMFVPKQENRPTDRIVVIFIGRLVYRKGIELLAQVIADVCEKYDDIDFIVGGSGPKMPLLKDLQEEQELYHRLSLLGALNHSEVSQVLTRAHIFLNTSLTEAYCMAIVEAACCGLQVVSTRVGGIPEVLPPEFMYFAEPTVASLIEGLERAVNDFKAGKVMTPEEAHRKVCSMYNWHDIAARTQKVYCQVEGEKVLPLGEHLKSYLKSGVWPFLLVVSLMYLILQFFDLIVPRHNIDIAKDFIYDDYLKTKKNKKTDENNITNMKFITERNLN